MIKIYKTVSKIVICRSSRTSNSIKQLASLEIKDFTLFDVALCQNFVVNITKSNTQVLS